MTSLLLHRGDIVLVPFPFTDLSGRKVRPVLIVSPDPVGEDISELQRVLDAALKQAVGLV